MKKFISSVTLSFLLLGSLITPAFAESNTQSTKDISNPAVSSQNEIKEGTVIKEENGWSVKVVTKKLTLEEFLAIQKQKNLEVHKTSIAQDSTISTNEVASPLSTASYLQEDHLYGSGSKTVSGLTGTCWTNDLLIGLNAFSGVISGSVYAYSAQTGVTSKPRVEFSTWGLVGGSYGVLQSYTFTSSSYGSGTVTKVINQNLSGAIAYYTISLYGDFVKGSTEFTSSATLNEK